jgi:hypothetical protein
LLAREGGWEPGREIGRSSEFGRGIGCCGLGAAMVAGILGDDLGEECFGGVEHGVGELAVGVGEAIVGEEVEVVFGGARLGAEVIDGLIDARIGGAERVEIPHGELESVEELAGDVLIYALLDKRGEDVDERGLEFFGRFEIAELDAGSVDVVMEAATTFADSGFMVVVAVGASAECGRTADESVGLDVMAAANFVHGNLSS